ncbi:hypothetical protein V8C26DRAFT_192755 [Trichoderma gracile]
MLCHACMRLLGTHCPSKPFASLVGLSLSFFLKIFSSSFSCFFFGGPEAHRQIARLALPRSPLPRDPPHRLIEQIPSVGPEPWPLARPPPDFLRVWPQTVSSWPELAPGTAAQWLNAYHRRPGYRSSGSPPVLPATDHTPGWANPSPLALRNGERHRNACSHSVGGRNLKALLTICHHLAVAPHGAPSRGRWQKLGGFELASL